MFNYVLIYYYSRLQVWVQMAVTEFTRVLFDFYVHQQLTWRINEFHNAKDFADHRV